MKNTINASLCLVLLLLCACEFFLLTDVVTGDSTPQRDRLSEGLS